MKLKKTALLTGLALSLGITAMQVNATNLRFAVGFPSGSPLEAAKEYAKFVEKESDGKHKVKVYEMSLLNHSEMSDGIGQGLADLGYLLTAYYPSDYPYMNMAHDMSMSTVLDSKIKDQEGYAYSGAMLEYVMLNCEECQDDYAKNNQVFTGVVSTSKYMMFCNNETTEPKDIKGKRVRISGASWARWVKHFDGNPVALPVHEIYEGLNQGVIDCALLSATELSNYNFIEVVKHITPDVPGGLFAAGGASTMNKNTWNKFDDNEKKMLLEAGAVMTSEVTYRYQDQADKDLKDAKEKGIKITEASDDLVKETHQFIKDDLEYIPEFYVKDHKMDSDRAKELTDKFQELVAKWNTIIADSDIESADDLKKLYWDEVYSKVDVSQYGK